MFCVLPVNFREVYILKFILTFRLVMDARLHQKTELRAENRPWVRAAKNITVDTKIFDWTEYTISIHGQHTQYEIMTWQSTFPTLSVGKVQFCVLPVNFREVWIWEYTPLWNLPAEHKTKKCFTLLLHKQKDILHNAKLVLRFYNDVVFKSKTWQ